MISWIAGDFFASSPVLAYPILALAIQISVFCGVALRTMFASDQTLESRSRMPLEDEGKVRHD